MIFIITNLMARLLFILIFACSMLHGQNQRNLWNRIDDDTKHFYAGVAITAITGGITYKLTDKPWLSIGVGAASGIAAGVLKEVVWDGMMRRGTVNRQDAYMTFWGTLNGTMGLFIFIHIDIKKRGELKEKYEREGKIKRYEYNE